MVGTLRRNKAKIPPSFKVSRTRTTPSSKFAFHRYLSLVLYMPKKSKNVFLLSSQHHGCDIDQTTRNCLLLFALKWWLENKCMHKLRIRVNFKFQFKILTRNAFYLRGTIVPAQTVRSGKLSLYATFSYIFYRFLATKRRSPLLKEQTVVIEKN